MIFALLVIPLLSVVFGGLAAHQDDRPPVLSVLTLLFVLELAFCSWKLIEQTLGG